MQKNCNLLWREYTENACSTAVMDAWMALAKEEVLCDSENIVDIHSVVDTSRLELYVYTHCTMQLGSCTPALTTSMEYSYDLCSSILYYLAPQESAYGYLQVLLTIFPKSYGWNYPLASSQPLATG
jgi:hypothetical protein